MNRYLLAAPVCAVAILGGLSGVALAEDDVDVRAALCAELGANVETPIADLSADTVARIAAAVGVDAGDLTGDVRTPAVVLDCGDVSVNPPTDPEPTDPPVVVDPTDDPDPTTDVPAPTSDVPAPTTAAPVPPATDLDCRDLTAAQAVSVLQADPSDPHRLDSDGDGVPCEVEDLAGDSPAESSPGGVSQVPSGSIDSGYVAE